MEAVGKVVNATAVNLHGTIRDGRGPTNMLYVMSIMGKFATNVDGSS